MANKITAEIVLRKGDATALGLSTNLDTAAQQVHDFLVVNLQNGIGSLAADLTVTVEDVYRDGTTKNGDQGFHG